MSDVRKTIATTIKSADKRLFNEDYDKQALAVLRGLSKNGFAVITVEPTDEMREKGKAAMTTGRHRPDEIIRAIYDALLTSGRLN